MRIYGNRGVKAVVSGRIYSNRGVKAVVSGRIYDNRGVKAVVSGRIYGNRGVKAVRVYGNRGVKAVVSGRICCLLTLHSIGMCYTCALLYTVSKRKNNLELQMYNVRLLISSSMQSHPSHHSPHSSLM